MIVQELELGLDYGSARLTVPAKLPTFTSYLPEDDGSFRPAVLVLPGGGYWQTSSHEGAPIAEEFVSAGIAAFVLHYSCAPDGVFFPTQLLQALQALKTIREHAAEWRLDPNQISVCGFSAGGHLAASVGALWNHEIVKKHGFAGEDYRPNGMILAYPVITTIGEKVCGSFENLLGNQPSAELLALVSLDQQVTADTPRAFLWHTYEDPVVPVEHSIRFAHALIAHDIPVELHIYPHGGHGLGLGNNPNHSFAGIEKLQSWMPFAKEWVYNR